MAGIFDPAIFDQAVFDAGAGNSRTATDTLTTSDSLARAPIVFARTATDTITIGADSVARTAPRTATDTLTTADSVSRAAASKTRTATDTMAVSDSLSSGLVKGIFDPAIFDPAIFQTKPPGGHTVDTLTISESVSRAAIVFHRTAADTLPAPSENVGKTPIVRTATDTLTAISDSPARIIKRIRTNVETISISENVGRTAIVRSATDTLTGLTDTVVRAAVVHRRSPTDSIPSSSSIARVNNKTRTATDVLPLPLETVGRNVFGRSASDSISLTDSLARSALKLRTNSDTLTTITESIVKRWPRTATDTITLGTTPIVRTSMIFHRLAVETIVQPFDTVGYAAVVPDASFTYSPTSGPEPLHVQFTDTSTHEPTSWAWDFGDGATSTEQHPMHIFAQGSWTVSLTVTNAAGSDSFSV